MDMKGAVAVGSESESGSGATGRSLGEYLILGFGGALVAGLLGLPAAEMRRRDRE